MIDALVEFANVSSAAHMSPMCDNRGSATESYVVAHRVERDNTPCGRFAGIAQWRRDSKESMKRGLDLGG
jgi:hypothetical protein